MSSSDTQPQIMTIGNRRIGKDEPVFVIAEISGNHKGDLERAKALVRTSCEAGADAVKTQTYTPDDLTIDSDKDIFQVEVNDAWKGRSLYELYKEAHTPYDWQPELKAVADECGVPLFSSVFDEKAVEFWEQHDAPAYKVASFEITDLELLRRVGVTGKPVIISRGMASVEEVQLALDTLYKSGAPEVAVLHCVSSYPAPVEEMNLATIADIRDRFGVVSGLSDHSLGIEAAITSVALGASIIEKHVTLDRSEGGVDAGFSLEPQELKQLVSSVCTAKKAIGGVQYGAGVQESENKVFRRSLIVVKDMKAGEQFNQENVRAIRPGYGLAPKHLHNVLGTTAATDIERGTPLSWEVIHGYEG